MYLKNRTEEQNNNLLSPKELSDVLDLGLTSTYALLAKGEIPSVRIGRLRKVCRTDVEKFIEHRTEGRR